MDAKTGAEFFEELVSIVAIPAFMPELEDSDFPFGQQPDKVAESIEVYMKAWRQLLEDGAELAFQ